MVSYKKTQIEKLSDDQFNEFTIIYDKVFPNIVDINRKRLSITDRISSYNAEWIFAFDGDKMVGFATVQKKDGYMFFFNFGVIDEYRGKGIGKKIFNMVRKMTQDPLEFFVDKTDEKVQKMYAKWGCHKIRDHNDKLDRYKCEPEPQRWCIVC